MSCKVYVGSLAWSTNDDSLRQRFEEFGEVVSATVIMDRETGRSKGFGFVEFGDNKSAQSAVDGMRDQDLDGRTVRVDLANSRPPREGGFGGGDRGDRGGRGGFRGGRGGYGDRDGGSRSYGDRDGGSRSYGGGDRGGDRSGSGRRDYGDDRKPYSRKSYDD